jgi:cytochrome P450
VAQFMAMHDELQAALRRDPGPLTEAIDEILRIHGPLVSNRRVTTRPAVLGGREIGVGERVTIMWVSANRDADAFDEACEFRLDRNPEENLLYGAGSISAPVRRSRVWSCVSSSKNY